MTKQSEQKPLIEKIGLGIEESLRLSPLTSRIYALLVLSNYNGLTFEEIRTFVSASKSSISVNLNVLTQLDFIEVYTKPGDRKRYFKLAKYSSLISLESEGKNTDNDMAIVAHINAYNKKYHPEKYIEERNLGEIFSDYLVKKQDLIQDTINKLKTFRDLEDGKAKENNK